MPPWKMEQRDYLRKRLSKRSFFAVWAAATPPFASFRTWSTVTSSHSAQLELPAAPLASSGFARYPPMSIARSRVRYRLVGVMLFNIEGGPFEGKCFHQGFRRKARFKSLRGKEQSISDGLVHIRQPDGGEGQLRERLFTLLPQFRRSAHLRNRVVRDRPSISSSYGEDASLVAIDGDTLRGSLLISLF